MEITQVEKNLERVNRFVFNIKKFFYKNPKIEQEYKKFLEQEKQELIY